MLTGPALGEALAQAIALKKVSRAEVARVFDIKGPSIYAWLHHGRIAKQHLTKLVAYFSDVVGPEHWGMSDPSQLQRPVVEILHQAMQRAATAVSNSDISLEKLVTRAEGAEFISGIYELLANGMKMRDLQQAPEMAALEEKYFGNQRGKANGDRASTRRKRSTAA